MIEDTMKGKASDPKIVSLIMVYTLSKALGISPLEIYQMPVSLVTDLLTVHGISEKLKYEEIEKAKKNLK